MIHPNIIILRDCLIKLLPIPKSLGNGQIIDIKTVQLVMEFMDSDLKTIIFTPKILKQNHVKKIM